MGRRSSNVVVLSMVASVVVSAVGLVAGGCSYSERVAPVDMAVWTTPPVVGERVRAALEREPTAAFPASIAVVRLGGKTHHARFERQASVAHETGKTVDSLIDHCRSLPMVTDVTPINMLAAKDWATVEELREAAASVRADLLLVASIVTQHSGEDLAWPVGLVTLGLFPTKVRSTETSATLALIDTRTGYVYAVAQARDEADQLANGWTSTMAESDARDRSERRAGEKLAARFEEAWRKVLNMHAGSGTPAAAGVVGK